MNKEWQTEYLLMDNSFRGVCRAVELTDQGKEVILAVEETYLAADICGRCLYRRQEYAEEFFPEECFDGDMMIPDRCKQYLEERCMKAGVKFYYGLYFVEEISTQYDGKPDSGRRIVRLAGKSGLISVFCRHVQWHQEEKDLNDRLSLRAWVRDKRDGSCGLVEASVNCNREKAPAENLMMLRQELLSEFQRKQKDHPYLVLGRFADRWSGSLETGSMSGTADVIVAGGGTAGAMAALYAARGGARTILLEPMYDLGGTSTLGGVNAYWFGASFLDTQEIDAEVDRLCESCGIERPAGMFGKYDAFHGGIKGLVLLKLCLQAGVEIHFGRLVYDVIRENGHFYEALHTGD